MSFRSRSRTQAPLSSRRRSLSSNSRMAPSSGGSGAYNYNGSSYGSSGSTGRPLSTGYFPSSGGASSYQSPYASVYSSRESLYGGGAVGRSSYGSGGGGYDSSRYNPSSYSSAGSSYSTSDRYVSPYSSSYDKGVTTASLTFKSPGLGPSNSFKSSRLLKTKSLSASNSSLNGVYGGPSSNGVTSAGATVAAIAATRSNSLREQERKSRNRTRSKSAAQRSISASSEKSEGYESGSERTSRSRLGSTASTATTSESKSSSSNDKTENGDGIDYKALWEAEKLENDKLRQMLKQKDDEAVQTRATLERFANATTKNSLSELEKRERRAMERKLSELEEELKQLDAYKSDNHRLKEENAALIRVISKLSK
ncbi:protein phosphatase 1 regulatory subunit 12A isoform X19 [Drosophila erecta]|uniref:Uncharacterized protein, isoform Q n=1 Tax=Drosophila erecta TaxID=7220 RepID=A0A0Q5UBY4_DROER|nr:protein phosphatase 1 regulatory subunit 12A isoform X19 [Drosophila erecta]KQS44173.1 uncharacterized protein Dere_GG15946, isoform Q [Drosophila erecta]